MLSSIQTAPLSVEEETHLAKRWRDHKDVKARDKLIMSNLRFAIGQIRKQARTAELEDIEQEVMLGMLEAANKFDPDRGVRFIGFAVHDIKVAIERAEIGARNIKLPPGAFQAVSRGASKRLGEESTEAARLAIKPMKSMSDDAFVGESDEAVMSNRISRIENLVDEQANAEPDESDRLREEALDKATPIERLVLVRHHIEGLNFDAISEEIGVCRQRVQQIESAACNRVRTGKGFREVDMSNAASWEQLGNALLASHASTGARLSVEDVQKWLRPKKRAKSLARNLTAWLALRKLAHLAGGVLYIAQTSQRTNSRTASNDG